MGNYDTRPIKFRQSITDFPLTVSLGEKCPSWALKRWGGNNGLRFIPSDDEGFSLRGNRQQLFYKGRRRSHRFTILNDGAFEYDIILLREPESNVITLRMDGAESFEFFRQPDFVSDPFLRGSYAVYKKQVMIGEGTGKLCHLHRPEIIDARGRRCWGELAVVGNELRITIPANWLGEAKYPVVVDPAIGSTTVGSQLTGPEPDFDYYDRPTMENQIAICRYSASQAITGQCTAFVYAYYDYHYEDVVPVLFNEQSYRPYWRLSKNQQTIPTNLYPSGQEGWKSGNFNINGSINSNSMIWFGVCSGCFSTRFDYGGDCFKTWNIEDNWLSDDLPEFIESTQEGTYYNIRFSWYFTYTGSSSSTNYVRTLTQGVKLADNKKLSRAIKRNTAQTAGVTSEKKEEKQFSRLFNESVNVGSGLNRIQELIRSCKETVTDFDILGKFVTLSRKCVDSVISTVNISRFPMLCREIKEQLSLTVAKWETRLLSRNFADSVGFESNIQSKKSFYRKVEDVISGIDNQEFTVLFYRSVMDTTAVLQANHGIRLFYREVKDTAENIDGIEHGADFFRHQTDGVHVESSLLRKAAFFVRIAAQLIISDFILGRFLRAKSEVILKSCVTREITLESKII
jgi:hypothetical protein